jgi:ATP-dependent Lon protease
MLRKHTGSEVLPVVPLRDRVMFPGISTRLVIGRPRSLAALQKALEADGRLMLLAQREPSVEEPEAADLYNVGVVSTVRLTEERSDAGPRVVLVTGIERRRVEGYAQMEPYIAARTVPLPETQEEVPAELRTRVLDLVRAAGEQNQALLLSQVAPDAPGLDYYMASSLDLPSADKQALLSEPSVLNRYRMLVPVLEVEAQIARAGQKIRARYALTPRERRAYLEERKKEVEHQLADLAGETADLEDLRARVAAADLPAEARQEAERELERLGRMAPGTPEYSVAEDYLHWLVSLPWHASTDTVVDLAEAGRVLDRDHYDREEVKERILEFLSVRVLKPEREGALLCLVGAPGVGKTSLGRSIADATRRKFHRISLGGAHDEADIRGHRRTYIGALPGRIIRAMRTVGVRNPVLQLDEVDKLGAGLEGDPASALLDVLDPEQNAAFVDSYLGVPFDLSQVMFIATANTTATIPPALLDRLEVVELPGYSTDEKIAIAARHLVPKQLEANGLDKDRVEFSADAIEQLVEGYTREAGVRSLERQIAAVCRKMARDYLSGKCCYRYVNAALVTDLLGPAPHERMRGERVGRPGVCPTLALTLAGAELLLVEVLRVDGSGRLIVTGNVGQVLHESAELAWDFWKSFGRRLGLAAGLFRASDFHVHFPGSKQPPGDTSAGLPIALALGSVLMNARLPEGTAAAGEITLRGRILAVDNVRERLAGAARAGIDSFILPDANRGDVEAARKFKAAEGLEVTFVRTVQEALRLVLPAAAGVGPRAGG